MGKMSGRSAIETARRPTSSVRISCKQSLVGSTVLPRRSVVMSPSSIADAERGQGPTSRRAIRLVGSYRWASAVRRRRPSRPPPRAPSRHVPTAGRPAHRRGQRLERQVVGQARDAHAPSRRLVGARLVSLEGDDVAVRRRRQGAAVPGREQDPLVIDGEGDGQDERQRPRGDGDPTVFHGAQQLQRLRPREHVQAGATMFHSDQRRRRPADRLGPLVPHGPASDEGVNGEPVTCSARARRRLGRTQRHPPLQHRSATCCGLQGHPAAEPCGA